MYSLTRVLPSRRLLVEQVPLVGTSLVIAELFYTFHSFTLECLAFLGTWYALDWVVSKLRFQRR